jgi:hypothetical protein
MTINVVSAAVTTLLYASHPQQHQVLVGTEVYFSVICSPPTVDIQNPIRFLHGQFITILIEWKFGFID